MKPHADFACNSKTCKTAKGATVYDLPVNATACPVCRSRRIIRLFSAPHLSRGIAKRADAMVGPEYQRQRTKRDAAKEQQRTSPMLAVDPKKHGGLSGAVSAALGMHVQIPGPVGAARPSGVNDHTLSGLKAAGAVRVPTQAFKDTRDPDPRRGR